LSLNIKDQNFAKWISI